MITMYVYENVYIYLQQDRKYIERDCVWYIYKLTQKKSYIYIEIKNNQSFELQRIKYYIYAVANTHTHFKNGITIDMGK